MAIGRPNAFVRLLLSPTGWSRLIAADAVVHPAAGQAGRFAPTRGRDRLHANRRAPSGFGAQPLHSPVQTESPPLEQLQIVRSSRHPEALDIQAGRIVLGRHLQTHLLCVVGTAPELVRQLLGRDKSEFPSGRVPLFICEECGDLDCGAVTVRVDIGPESVVWSDFVIEAPWDPNRTQDIHYARTGPIAFRRDDYESVLSPYAAS